MTQPGAGHKSILFLKACLQLCDDLQGNHDEKDTARRLMRLCEPVLKTVAGSILGIGNAISPTDSDNGITEHAEFFCCQLEP
jgi:hypothetical protein